MNRRQVSVSGLLLAALLTPAAFVAAQPDCSKPQPPTGSVRVTGPQVRVGDRLIVAPGARVEVTATDAAGGAASWTPLIDGRESTGWPISWQTGEHTAGAMAVDSCDRRASLAPVAFVVDTEPPAIRWEVGDQKTFANRLAPDSEHDRRKIRYARSEGKPANDSWISVAGIWQVPLAWVKNSDPTFLSRARYAVQIANNRPQAFLAAPGTVAALDGTDAKLGDRLLWIAAEDAGAGVQNLTLRVQNEQDRAVLQVEATDAVGNTSRKEIPLRRGGQATR